MKGGKKRENSTVKAINCGVTKVSFLVREFNKFSFFTSRRLPVVNFN